MEKSLQGCEQIDAAASAQEGEAPPEPGLPASPYLRRSSPRRPVSAAFGGTPSLD
jgi:hypothetical protein